MSSDPKVRELKGEDRALYLRYHMHINAWDVDGSFEQYQKLYRRAIEGDKRQGYVPLEAGKIIEKITRG